MRVALRGRRAARPGARRPFLLIPALALWALAAGPADALGLLGGERSVFAEAEAFDASDFDSRFAEDGAPDSDAGPFTTTASAAASVAAVSGSAEAFHSSALDDALSFGRQILAQGGAEAQGMASAGVFGQGSFAAESFFEVFLQGSGGFWLEGQVETLLGGGEGLANLSLVERRDGQDDVVLVDIESDDGNRRDVFFRGVFDPDAVYQLRARAIAVTLVDEFDPMGGGGSSFDLTFVALPEPGPVWLLGVGVALGFGVTTRRGSA